MILIILLTCVIIAALAGLSVLDRIDQKNRRERLRLRRLQAYAEDLQDILSTLTQTQPTPKTLLAINQHLIDIYEEMLSIPNTPNETIEPLLVIAREHQQQWQEVSEPRVANYTRESDAQIARTQMHLNGAMELLPTLAGKDIISAQDLPELLNQLRWAHLMISTMSFIAQGDRAMAISDRFSAFAFYRKAQQLLMESLHSDPRRVKLIRELGEIIDGDREDLSDDCRLQIVAPA